MTTPTPSAAAPPQNLDVLVPVAAHGLAGSVVEVPPGPFAPDRWFELVQACEARGLLGMLAVAAQRGAVALSAEQREELALRENEAAAVALLVEQGAVRLSALLTAGGVRHRLLGPPARARLGYRQPGARLFETATVLVEPGDRELAAARGVTVSTTVPLTAGRTIDVLMLSDPPSVLLMAAHQIPTVSVEEHLVLACLEVAAASGDGPDGAAASPTPDVLAVRRDIAELALTKEIDGSRVQRVAEGWGVSTEVAKALVGTWDLFRLADRTRLSVWARRVANPPVAQRSATTGAVPYPSAPPRRRRRVRRLVHKARKLTPSRVAVELAARWPRARRSNRR